MSRSNYLFTSESVSEGHPDKVCDQISDAILDAFIANDVKLGIADDSLVNTRLGCETLCTTNKIVIAGEGRGQAPLFRKYGMTIVGFWQSTSSPNTLIYLLAYKDRAARDASWAGFNKDAEWAKVRTAMNVKIATEAVFMSATDYSPMK